METMTMTESTTTTTSKLTEKSVETTTELVQLQTTTPKIIEVDKIQQCQKLDFFFGEMKDDNKKTMAMLMVINNKLQYGQEKNDEQINQVYLQYSYFYRYTNIYFILFS